MARILIVDDDDLVRLALRADLEPAGHQVIEAADGQQGLDFYRGMPIDLVIVDIVMPEVNGLEEIQALRRINPALKIIAVTGKDPDGKKGYLALAEEYGAHRTFSKPFDAGEMRRAVEELLKLG